MSTTFPTANQTQVDPPDGVAADADFARPDRTVTEEAMSDSESWLPVYFLFGTLFVFFALGGFWIWHFAR